MCKQTNVQTLQMNDRNCIPYLEEPHDEQRIQLLEGA